MKKKVREKSRECHNHKLTNFTLGLDATLNTEIHKNSVMY